MQESASSTGQVTTIVLFRGPPENSAAFVDAGTASNGFMSVQPGLIGGTRFQATSQDAEHLFVNVASWASQATLDTARAEHARSLAAQGIDQKAPWASLGIPDHRHEARHSHSRGQRRPAGWDAQPAT